MSEVKPAMETSSGAISRCFMFMYFLLPHRVSVISFMHRTDTLARCNSIIASSTLLSGLQCRSMMAVSNEIPLRLGTSRVTSLEVVVRLRL